MGKESVLFFFRFVTTDDPFFSPRHGTPWQPASQGRTTSRPTLLILSGLFRLRFRSCPGPDALPPPFRLVTRQE